MAFLGTAIKAGWAAAVRLGVMAFLETAIKAG
jgi:hypothetical protein